jgi:signal transduction histidine kinase
MKLRLGTRIAIRFALIAAVLAAAAVYIGIRRIDEIVRVEELTRTDYSMRLASMAFRDELQGVREALDRAVNRAGMLAAVRSGTASEIQAATVKAAESAGVDYLVLVDGRKRAIARGRESGRRGDDMSAEPGVAEGFAAGTAFASVEVISRDRLEREGVATTGTAERPESKATAGMALQAVFPITDEKGEVAAVLISGILANGNRALAERLRDAVFMGEKYEGRDAGAVTIFLHDARIATSARNADGNMATENPAPPGAREAAASEERQPWRGRDVIAGEPMLAACKAVRNREGKAIGMLQVGLLEEKYSRMRLKLIAELVGAAMAGFAAFVTLGSLAAASLSRPVRELTSAVTEISQGNFDRRASEESGTVEVAVLARSVNTMARAVQDRDGQIRASADDMQRVNEMLQRANRNYTETLRIMSQEIRALVGTAAMSARSIADGNFGPLQDKQKRPMEALCRNLDHAAFMARNLLDLARIEKGELRLQRAQVKVREEAIEPALREMSRLIAERGMKVVQKIPQDLSVNCDPSLLKTVYINFLSNAVRYGKDQGLIELRGRREENRVVLSVFNEGVGVPREHRGRLFQKFSRVQETMLPTARGAGLGLFIVKEIVSRHGGEVWVDGEEGKNICFHFSLPLRPPAEQGEDSVTGRQPQAGTQSSGTGRHSG